MRRVKMRIANPQRTQKAFKKLMKRKRIYRQVEASIARRRAAEKRFRAYGLTAILIAFVFLVTLLWNIIGNGYSGFLQTQIQLSVVFDEAAIQDRDYNGIMKQSLAQLFPDAQERTEKKDLNGLVSKGAGYRIQAMLAEDAGLIGQAREVWVPASSHVDMFIKGKILEVTPEEMRSLTNQQIRWIHDLQAEKRLRRHFNFGFFTSGDSRDPEIAGVLGGIVGSLMVIISCMLLAFPLGVLTAIYLEEFAPKNWITDFIEVNINNLAAVPSIVFGLLGLTIYIQFFGLPRSAALAGGLTLALMALPVIVIATRASIRAIPQSIRDGAIALGASDVQTTLHHVLPLAMPGIMTGTILSIARVLGETAPLLMIGMVAFVVEVPHNFTDAATAMPVQIYLWADSSELGFVEKTSAAIMVLLAFLIIANSLAVYLRKKFEIRW